MAAAAYDAGIRTLIVPTANRAEASLVEGLQILDAADLATLVGALRGDLPRDVLVPSSSLITSL